MKRRRFLQLCGAAGIGFAAPIDRSLADQLVAQKRDELPNYEGPYYVVINAAGGWDTTYLMDPKGVNEINRLYKQGEIETAGEIRFAPNKSHINAGMSNEEFFAKYGKELFVFNGLDYSVNNHSPCSRYMATGKLDSLAYPTFAALVAACKNKEAPLAFLTFGNYSATGNLVAMSRVPYMNSLNRLANADGIQGSSRNFYHDDFVANRIEKALEKQMERRIKQPRLPQVERSQSMLYAAQLNSKALKRITEFVPKQTAKERLARQADIALASFKAGVCVSANLSIGQFDSHANNDRDQMKLIPELLAGVDYVLRKSEELKLREKMVLVIQSEMGRTPNYNKGNGKDHWSIGSVMFIGKDIAGNRIIGETDEKQFLKPIDPKTLKVSDEGIRVRPEHVHLALRQKVGIEKHAACEQFPFVIPQEEQLVNFFG